MDAYEVRPTVEDDFFFLISIRPGSGHPVTTVYPFSVVLSVSSINAFVDNAHETSRLSLVGESVLEAGHVFSCSIKKLDRDCYTFIGFVLQTSALTSYELEITLNGRNVNDTSCSIKA
ncbi:uncharacterized protein ISCGN_002066 [Ixodes scapularis]